jgi:hypothetical protein
MSSKFLANILKAPFTVIILGLVVGSVSAFAYAQSLNKTDDNRVLGATETSSVNSSTAQSQSLSVTKFSSLSSNISSVSSASLPSQSDLQPTDTIKAQASSKSLVVSDEIVLSGARCNGPEVNNPIIENECIVLQNGEEVGLISSVYLKSKSFFSITTEGNYILNNYNINLGNRIGDKRYIYESMGKAGHLNNFGS